MIERDHRGRINRTNRQVKTNMHAEILLGHDWQDIAYIELTRLLLEVSAYHTQLRDKVGFEETGTAVEALQAACDKLQEEFGEDQNPRGDLL